MKIIHFIAATALVTAPGLPWAAEGDLDLTFDGDGKQTVVFDGSALAFSASVAAGDALYLVGGALGENEDIPPGIAIARLLKDGAPDTSFDGDGMVFHQPFPGEATMFAAAIQPDGKLVTAGTAQVDTFPEINYAMAVCRFETSGAPDTGFGDIETPGCRAVDFDLSDSGLDVAEGVLIQPDGKIVIVGFASESGLNRAVMARLRPDGSTDNTGDDAFGENGRVVLLPSAPSGISLVDVAQASDGRLVAVGTLSVDVGDSDMLVFRVDASGTPDPSLNGAGLVQVAFDLGGPGFKRDDAAAVHVFDNDAILVAGSADFGPLGPQMAVAKLTSAGSPDTTFDGDGKAVWAFCDVCDSAVANDMAVQTDGRIVLAGSVSVAGAATDFGVMRLEADGERDDSFGSNGAAFVEFNLDGLSSDVGQAVVLQNGRIVVAGHAQAPGDNTFYFGVARLESDLIFEDDFELDGE